MRKFLIVSFLLMGIFIVVSCSAPTSSSPASIHADPVDLDPWTAEKFNKTVYTVLTPKSTATYFKIHSSGDKMVLYVSTVFVGRVGGVTYESAKKWAMNSAAKGGSCTIVSHLIPNKPEMQMYTDNESGTKYRVTFDNTQVEDGFLEQNSGSGWVKIGDFHFAGKLK